MLQACFANARFRYGFYPAVPWRPSDSPQLKVARTRTPDVVRYPEWEPTELDANLATEILANPRVKTVTGNPGSTSIFSQKGLSLVRGEFPCCHG